VIPPPAGELQQWTADVLLSLLQYGILPVLNEDDWQRWGVGLFDAPQLAVYHPPNPYDYSDWREWGAALTTALAAIPGANRVAI